MKKRIFSICATLFMLLAFVPFSTFNAGELNFSIKTVIPENQKDKKKTYFDLMMQPNQEQTLEVKVKSTAAKQSTIDVKIAPATTNSNGVVQYNNNDVARDSTLKYNMVDLVTCPSEISVPANGEATLKLHVKMPEETFDGVIAGGITFQERDDGSDTTGAPGMAIVNKFAYAVAIVLHATDKEVKPELVLHSVKADQINLRNVISSNIQNTQAAYVHKLSIKADVTQKGSKDVLYTTTKENMQMAPNSNLWFPIRLEGKEFKAGNYTMRIVAKSGDQEWKFEKDFTIDNRTAQSLNDKDVNIVKDNTWWYILMGVACGVAAALLIVLIVWLAKRKKKPETTVSGDK